MATKELIQDLTNFAKKYTKECERERERFDDWLRGYKQGKATAYRLASKWIKKEESKDLAKFKKY